MFSSGKYTLNLLQIGHAVFCVRFQITAFGPFVPAIDGDGVVTLRMGF